MPPAQYSAQDLKVIGKQCGNRLPPATAVQAMFLYEMQREVEAERLFHSKMFSLAQAEETSQAQHERIAALERRLSQLERRDDCGEADTGKSDKNGGDDIDGNCKYDRADPVFQKWVCEQLKMRGISTVRATQAAAEADRQTATDAASNADEREEEMESEAATTTIYEQHAATEETWRTMKEEIDVLFDDRDGMLHMLHTVRESIDRLEDSMRELRTLHDFRDRIDRLEGTVRQLTIQKTEARARTPPRTHRIPIKNAAGELVDLSVPKGTGLAHSRRGIPQSFTPGKTWV